MRRIFSPARRPRWLSRGTSLLLAILGGCGQAELPLPDPDPSTAEDSIGGGALSTPDEGELVYDREFIFLSEGADTLVVVPWFFRTRVTQEGLRHEQIAWLSQAGNWEVLGEQIVDTPPTRSPWRLLPGATIRLIVGPDDRVESLVLRDPPRELETVLGNLMTEWTSPGAQSIRLYQGRTLFPAGPIDGIVMEISRRWEGSDDGGPGDWVFVRAESNLQFFMEGERPVSERGAPVSYSGWSRVSFRDLQWPDLALEWEEVRPFESARRDIPVRWGIGTPGGEVSGSLESVSSHVIVGQGDGPILPLIALFEVSGSIEVEGEEFSVSGIIRHVQR